MRLVRKERWTGDRWAAGGSVVARHGRRMPIGVRAGGIVLLFLALTAHVGTDDVSYAGQAGPYPVRVTIRQPGVIPGLAEITVRVEGSNVRRVLVTALRRIADAGEAPPADEAKPVAGVSGLYSAELWLMTRGPHSVIVTVEGGRGEGRATIPVMARATRRLAMTRGLETFLLLGGLFLVVGLITIVGAATRESVLDAGDRPGLRERHRAQWAMSLATLVIAAILYGGWTWIRSDASQFEGRIDRPWSVDAEVVTDGASRRLDLAITDSLWIMRNDSTWLQRNLRYRRADLIADHGKIMHLFLVREPDMDAFAHIHPVTSDEDTFRVTVPPLPAGRYRVYADLAEEDGAAQTLVAQVDLPEPPRAETPKGGDNAEATRSPPVDPDDAWWIGADTAPVGTGNVVIRRIGGERPVSARTDADLGFEVTDADGRRVALEPYMGMLGHAMLNRKDGQVFLHVHPVGMVSMAAMEALAREEDSGIPPAQSPAMSPMPGMSGDSTGSGMAPATGTVRFPFVAPSAGTYRMWVQVKVAGRVVTRAFDIDVR